MSAKKLNMKDRRELAKQKKDILKKLQQKARDSYIKTKKEKGEEQKQKTENRKLLREIEKQKKTHSFIPKSTQDTMPYIIDYEKGIFEIDPGVFSKSYSFSDINYLTSRTEDQETVFLRYGDLLNSFNPELRPSITINCKNINRDNLEKGILALYQEDGIDPYREEYNEILKEQLSVGQNEMQKLKTIQVTVKAENIVDAMKKFQTSEVDLYSNIKSIGSYAAHMSSEDRLEVLYDFFHPGQEGAFSINLTELKQFGISTKDIIAPDSIEFQRDYFRMGDHYARCLYLNDFPTYMVDKFINELTEFNFNTIVTITLEPLEAKNALKLIKNQITGMESNKIEKQKKAIRAGYDPNMIPHELQLSLEEGEELLKDVQGRNQKVFFVSFGILHVAESKDVLDEQTKSIQSIARKNLCSAQKLGFQQEDAMKQILPMGHDKLKIKRTLTTESTAIFMPFSSREIMQKGGSYYGLNAMSHRMLIINRKKLQNQNGFILGVPGSGKSFSAKNEMTNVYLTTNDDVIIIDPEDEYGPLVREFQGETINISNSSKDHVNPLDMSSSYADTEDGSEDPVSLKSDFILSLFKKIMERSLSAVEKSIIDSCVKAIYDDYIQHNYDKKYIPTLLDLHNTLLEQKDREAIALAKALEIYTKGSLNTFAHITNIDPKKRMVVYNIKGLGKSLKGMGLLIILDSIWNRLTENRKAGKRTWIYIDEIYLLFEDDESANFLEELYKRARKWGGIPTGITQNVETLLKSKTAKTMLSNSDFLIMLNQAASDREELIKILGISDTELAYIKNSKEGEGLIKAGPNIFPFINKFPSDTKLYRLMTTKPEDLKKTKVG